MCSERKSGIHGRTEGQLGDEKHTYMLYVSVIFLYPWKHSRWRISQITNAHSPFIKAHAWQLMTTSNDVVARWDTSQLPLCSTAEQSRRHTSHTQAGAESCDERCGCRPYPLSPTLGWRYHFSYLGCDGGCGWGRCRRWAVARHLSQAQNPRPGSGKLNPLQNSHKKPINETLNLQRTWLNWKRCLIRVLHFAKKLHKLCWTN